MSLSPVYAEALGLRLVAQLGSHGMLGPVPVQRGPPPGLPGTEPPTTLELGVGSAPPKAQGLSPEEILGVVKRLEREHWGCRTQCVFTEDPMEGAPLQYSCTESNCRGMGREDTFLRVTEWVPF